MSHVLWYHIGDHATGHYTAGIFLSKDLICGILILFLLSFDRLLIFLYSLIKVISVMSQLDTQIFIELFLINSFSVGYLLVFLDIFHLFLKLLGLLFNIVLPICMVLLIEA